MAEAFYPQEREMTCAVAALRSVLATQFGIHIREELLRFAGDDIASPILHTGTDIHQLRRMLESANRAANPGPRWRLHVRRNGTIADLAREVRAGRYPLAAVQGATDKAGQPVLHMVVICGYKPGRIRVFDPFFRRPRWFGVGAFRKQWSDTGITWMASVRGGIALP